MKQYGFDSPLNLVGAIGIVSRETASTFMPVREAWFIYDPNDPIRAEQLYQANPTPAWNWYSDTSKHAAYSGGPNYHGRGFDQCTHDYNYKKVEDESGQPVVANPDLLLTDSKLAAIAFAQFWRDHGIPAMCEARQWDRVRMAVLGGSDPEGTNRIIQVAARLGV